jgi:N-acetylmuramoyl-L-alanine amidase
MRYSFFLILFLIIPAASFGQSTLPDFTGYKIFINPGHGGYDSDDRHMITTGFWESEGNLVKGLFLRELMTNMKATVFMSRTTNTTADDLSLTAISAMANSANVDFFLAIHSNGFDGNQNQPLMLYKGYDNQPAFPESKVMAGILWQKVFERGNCWTNSSVWVKGDWTFYPEWGTQGLGVLRSLAMPGVLSEGSFHDYIPESWRLRNSNFLHLESWAFARAFIEYKNVKPVGHGLIAGIIRDPLRSPSWYFKSGTKDAAMPLNGAKVTLKPGNKIRVVDNLNNGFFMFDSLSPGNYKLYFEGVKDFMNDSLPVTVSSNKSTLADIALQYDTTIVPKLILVSPSTSDSLLINQEFTFCFDLAMNKDSVQKALSFNPSVQLVYSWDEKGTLLRVKPTVQYAPKTNYVLTISTSACSKWNVKIAAPSQLNFVTKNRTKLKLEKSFPLEGQKKITLFPQIRLVFDAPLDQSGISSNIQLLNETGQQLVRIKEEKSEKEGKGIYYFELSEPLELNKVYRIIINPDLADIAGMKFGQSREISFTTRETAYQTGSIIEPFDDISRFWDPESSGSTVGTDNPLTTFTSSVSVKKSGTASGKLDYVFVNTTGGVCRVFDTQKPSIGSDNSKYFAIWVFGDLSFNTLEYWFYSSGTVNQIVTVDTIDWAGWDLKIIPVSKISGSGERNFHSVVINQASGGAKAGTIYFDEAQLLLSTSIYDMYQKNNEINLLSYPNPFASTSAVSFTLKERANVKLEVYTQSGQRIVQIYDGVVEPGSYVHNWTPSVPVSSGIYIYRLELHKMNIAFHVIFTQKCILIR